VHLEQIGQQYDKQMTFYDRRLFESGRDWVGSQAQGEVLDWQRAESSPTSPQPCGSRESISARRCWSWLARRRTDWADESTVQRSLDWFSVRLAGDHLVREPLDHLRAEGFEIERVERSKSKWGIVERVAARKRS